MIVRYTAQKFWRIYSVKITFDFKNDGSYIAQ